MPRVIPIGQTVNYFRASQQKEVSDLIESATNAVPPPDANSSAVLTNITSSYAYEMFLNITAPIVVGFNKTKFWTYYVACEQTGMQKTCHEAAEAAQSAWDKTKVARDVVYGTGKLLYDGTSWMYGEMKSVWGWAGLVPGGQGALLIGTVAVVYIVFRRAHHFELRQPISVITSEPDSAKQKYRSELHQAVLRAEKNPSNLVYSSEMRGWLNLEDLQDIEKRYPAFAI